MTQQFDVVLNIQLQHKEQIKKNIQVSCKWEDSFIDLKIALTDRNKFRDCRKTKLAPKQSPTKNKSLLPIREMKTKYLCWVLC